MFKNKKYARIDVFWKNFKRYAFYRPKLPLVRNIMVIYQKPIKKMKKMKKKLALILNIN